MDTHYNIAWLEAEYNNRARVPDHAAYFARWGAQSAAVRAEMPCTLDIPYGDAPAERLDVFPAARDIPQAGSAPVLVFIHGGYWRSLDKSQHSFVAGSFAQAGACVVVPGYTLCPAVTIPGVTLQMVRAVAWTYRNIARFGGDPSRITVAGHSAGGHLAAMMLACLWRAHDAGLPAQVVENALSISGLYDLAPLMHTPSLQSSLQLTREDVLRASPARLPVPRAATLYAVAGADESAEFLRHNRLIQEAWGKKSVPVCESHLHCNHFSVLDAFARPGHRLNRFGLDLLGLA